MKLFLISFILFCGILDASSYPYAYYGNNFDSLSYGSSDVNRGGMVLSRYYNPYYNPRTAGGGMAAFMFKPEQQGRPQYGQYYVPDRRRQTQLENSYVPQQNEVYYPQTPDQPVLPEQPAALPDLPVVTEATEVADPTEKVDSFTTTAKAIVVQEIEEPEIEEVPKSLGTPKRRLTKKKQVKRPVDDEEEYEDYPPKMPTGAYFPMFFGWGGRSSSGAPGGATAIANAFSTGRGGVATSHATAYGPPKPDHKYA